MRERDAEDGINEKKLHFSPNYFFPNRESQQGNTQETHDTSGFSTETRTEMPI